MSHQFQIRDSVLTHDGQRGEIIAVSSEGYIVRLDGGERQPFGADQLRVLGKHAINANMPAYPQERDWQNDLESYMAQPTKFGAPPSMGTGFTKREELAARNMAALLAQPVENYWSLQGHMAALARTAIAAADALLEEIER